MENAIACMARHLNPGWVHLSNLGSILKTSGSRLTSEYIDEAGRKISRMFIARREGKLSVYDIHYLVGTSQSIEYFIEREVLGLFTHAEYLNAFEKAGLRACYDKNASFF